MYLYVFRKGGCILATPTEKKDPEPLIRRISLVTALVLVVSSLSYSPARANYVKPIVTDYDFQPIAMSELFVDTTPPAVEIVVTQSEYQKKQEEERLAALAKKKAARANFNGNLATSGDSYGNYTKVSFDSRSRFGSCVPWAKEQTGIYRTIGNGARSGIQGNQPQIGAIIALKGATPHAGVVVSFTGSTVTFNESGYLNSWITQRTVPLSMAIGYVYK